MLAGLADALTRAALDIYAALPPKGKPGKRGGNGSPEWTVLAAFLVFRALEGSDDCWEVRCVSLGTGLRALPHARLPVHGDVLHDSHAEVIARRGFHCWLYDEVVRSNSGDETSVLQEVEGKGGEKEWRLRDGWKVGMYVSTLPCGDASTYLLAVQDADNSASSSAAPPPTVSSSPSPARSTPTESTAAALHPSLSTALSLGLSLSRSTSISPSCSSPASTLPPSVIRGRNDYTSLSTLRTKPGRADSPPTTSHSCSDKIALWALLGVQGGLLSVLGVRRMPVEMLVVGSEGVPSGGRDRVREEIRRAVGGRLEDWVEKVGLRDEFVVPTVEWTDRGFVHSREAVARRGGVGKEAVAGCPETFSYVLGASPAVEVVTGGIRQSASSKRNPGEALGPKQRSRLCKLSLFQRHLEVSALLASPPPAVPPSSPFASPISLTYHSHKHSPRTLLATTHDALDLNLLAPLHRYQLVKALVRRRVDASTSTSEPVGFGARSREVGPFAGWLVSGKEWESFNGEGRVVVEEL